MKTRDAGYIFSFSDSKNAWMHGGGVISDDVIVPALAMLVELDKRNVPPARIYPTLTNTIQFEWRCDDEVALVLVVSNFGAYFLDETPDPRPGQAKRVTQDPSARFIAGRIVKIMEVPR